MQRVSEVLLRALRAEASLLLNRVGNDLGVSVNVVTEHWALPLGLLA